MSKKGKSLVDSLVFNQAKIAVDRVTSIPKKDGKNSDCIRIISGSYQDQNNITKGHDKEQIHIMSVSPKEQHKVSPKEQHCITIPKTRKSITKGATSISLSKSQSDVYLWFSDKGINGEFNKPEIQHSLSMPYITVRKAIVRLEMLDIIKLKYDKCLKLYEYSLNPKVNIKFSKKSSVISGSYQDHITKGAPSPYSSSSFFIKKTTTTKNLNLEINKNPELGYWRQKKITTKQIIAWMKIANCNSDLIIQYLCYCRFEMVDLNLEKSKPIENVFNWFFRILEKTGGYPKPKGYKSFQEKKIEEERQLAEKKKKEAREIREIYKQKIEAEQDLKFWDMMNNPDGKLFKACFKKLNAFQKRKTTGKVFEMSMRNNFDKISSVSD